MFRATVAFAAVVAGLILAGAGCKNQQQEKPKTPATINAPTPSPTPTPTAAPVASPSPAATPKDTPKPVAGPEVGDSLDPRVAGVLPRSGEAGGWTRIEKVSLFEHADLGKVDGPDNSGAEYGPYHVNWTARTAYQLGDEKLIVQLFGCAKPADAYGLLTMRSDQASAVKLGADVEVRGGEPSRLHACKGAVVLSLWPVSPRQQGADFSQAQVKLAEQILAKLPNAPIVRPELLALLPTRGIVDSKIRLYRGDEFLSGHNSELSKVARLESDDELAVADYQVAADQPAVTMFIARYSSESKARDAYDRLHKSELNPSANAAFAVNLLVGGIKGNYVYGSLTAEAYGVMERSVGDNAADAPVMPTIQGKLP